MYKKVKFLIYASLFLFFIFLFTAVQQKSSIVAEQKEQEKIEQDMIRKAEKYQKINEEQYKAQNREKRQSSDVSQTPVITYQSQNNQAASESSQTNTNEYQQISEKSSDNTMQQTQEKLYFVLNNEEASGYLLCNRFQFNGNNYAIVSFDDTRYISEYSKYINRKFYIYKESEQKLYRVHYLFEKSVPKDNRSLPDFSVIVNKYDVKITYNIKPPVTRTLSSNILVNSGNQYKEIPVLTTHNSQTGSSVSEDDINTNIQDENFPELESIEPEK